MSENRRGRRRKYDDEFKSDALKLVDNGQTVKDVAQSLGITETVLYKWRSERRANASSTEVENMELRAKVRQLELERDILKKALSIFSRER